MFIEISNQGEIEVDSFKLLGASTKREDSSKIGFFGSGIKYSISYLLRHGLDFKIFSGEREIKFTLKSKTFRDQTFEQVLVDDVETSITTSWGSNWDRWQIFREMVSNAIDEGQFNLNKVTSAGGEQGTTKIFVKYSDFESYFENIENYFLLHDKNKEGILLKNCLSDLIVYKNGVRVIKEVTEGSTSSKLPNSIFNYNLSNLSLNEERIADRWSIEHYAARELSYTADKAIIRRLYTVLTSAANSGVFEYTALESSTSITLSEQWLEVIESENSIVASASMVEGLIRSKGANFIREHRVQSVPDGFYNRIKESFGERFIKTVDTIEGVKGEYLELKTTKFQEKCLKKSLALIEAAGVNITYPIKIVDFFMKTTLGMAKDDTIFLSEKVFDTGQLLVMSTLLEEYIHLKHKVSDETRMFQDVTLNLLANVIYNNVEL